MTKNQQKIKTDLIGIADVVCILWDPLDEQPC